MGGPHPPTASPSRLVRSVTCAPVLGSRALVLLGTLWRRLEPLARSRRRRLRARWRGVHFRSPDRSGVPVAVRGAPRITASCHLLHPTLSVKTQRVIAVSRFTSSWRPLMYRKMDMVFWLENGLDPPGTQAARRDAAAPLARPAFPAFLRIAISTSSGLYSTQLPVGSSIGHDSWRPILGLKWAPGGGGLRSL